MMTTIFFARDRSQTVAVFLLLSVVLGSCSLLEPHSYLGSGEQHYEADVVRTVGGIPHVIAGDLGSLGFATNYTMAEDNACIMAKQFAVLGARSAQLIEASEENIASDFFYQLLIDRGMGAEPISPELQALFRGAAAGYNHYIETTGVNNLPDARCNGADWVVPVTEVDTRRVSRIELFLDRMRPMIMAAQPPEPAAAASVELDPVQIAAAINAFIEKPKQGGSNGLAVGGELSHNGRGMLLANPHMPWHEEFQRFYPMQQTIPGYIDMVGATIVGRPRVGFGTTEHVAWTSTVSPAQRMTFYKLKLVEGHPRSYWFDGEVRAMQRETVKIPVANENGGHETREHTFYSTHFGAMLVVSEFFQWNNESAYAVQLLDPGWRSEEAAFDQFAAKSVRDLKAVHDRGQFLMVHLIAADRKGDVVLSEPGPVPNLTNEQLESCGLLGGKAMDGSRSACLWSHDADAAVPGIIGPSRLPTLYRSDYVLNSNDSYWLSHHEAMLDGFPKILGDERTQRTLRTRSAFDMVLELVERKEQGSGAVTLGDLQTLLYENRHKAGELLQDDLQRVCQRHSTVELDSGESVDLGEACEVLGAWDLRADVDSRGSHIVREMLSAANEGKYIRYMPEEFTPEVPFDVERPIVTPAGLSEEADTVVAKRLAMAVMRLREAGLALDAPLGELQYVVRNGETIPIHGGSEIEGVYNKVEADFVDGKGYPEVTRTSSSWIMTSEFSDDGPVVEALLAYSLSSNPDSPYFADQTKLFSGKQWLQVPFNREDVEAAAIRSYSLRSAAPRADLLQ